MLVVLLASPLAVYAEPLECSCVMWLREARGIPIYGDAKTHIPNLPIIGAEKNDILLFDYEGVRHDALVLAPYADGWMVTESNFKKCKVTTRFIGRTDPHLVGALRVKALT